jgi:hypothetical protein
MAFHIIFLNRKILEEKTHQFVCNVMGRKLLFLETKHQLIDE